MSSYKLGIKFKLERILRSWGRYKSTSGNFEIAYVYILEGTLIRLHKKGMLNTQFTCT